MTMLAFIDEFGDYFGGRNDSLKEGLRNIDGIPNASYLVKDGQVFVFDKLVQLVAEHRTLQPELPIGDLALSLITKATVSAKDAVETWGVVPEPYELVAHPASGFMIRHRPFNAFLPGAFQSKDCAQDAFANLLLGGIQPGSGDFAYRDQPMTLCDPIDTALLPPRPVIQCVEEEADGLCYTALGNVTYEPGFDPVSKSLFDDVKEREAEWKNDSNRAARYAQEHVADIWVRAETLQLETLNDPAHEVPEYGQEDFAELRQLYPELSMLSDGTLYAWFDEYQSVCCYVNGWTANRDNGFLFYLLGNVAICQHEQDTEKVGKWVAYALLRGDALDDALAFGRAADLYDSAISRLAQRIADAIRFLVENKKATGLHGRTITTMTDMFRMSRSYNFTTHLAEQNIEDFGINKKGYGK